MAGLLDLLSTAQQKPQGLMGDMQPRPPFLQQGDAFSVPSFFAQPGRAFPQFNYDAMPMSQNIEDRRGSTPSRPAQMPFDLPTSGMRNLDTGFRGLFQMPYGGPTGIGGLPGQAGINSIGATPMMDLMRQFYGAR